MNKLHKIIKTLLVFAFWIVIWELISAWVDRDILVSSPMDVAKRFIELLQSPEFYIIVWASICRILTGFVIAVILGIVLGVCSVKIPFMEALISPLLTIIKATPVASFIILTLVWLDKESIPSFISFLMVFPIIHSNVSAGLKNTPKEWIEMTRIYHFRFYHKITKLYIPSILPYFMAAFKTSLALAWKAGVAAEVLCFPKYSIGKELYEAKTYLETIDIFTWTITIILLSLCIEKVLVWIMKKLVNKKTGESYDQNRTSV